MFKKPASAVLVLLLICGGLTAQVDFDTLAPNTWVQIPTSGQSPTYGVETHLAFDTSGYAYMVGSCSYGGAAGGTHNNDIFRFNVRTGETAEIFTCGTNPWPGGCQAPQVFDPKRNCVWFGPGWNAACRTSGVLWHPGVAYYSGLYRMQCPSGPIEAIHLDTAIGATYMLMDTANDLLIGVDHNNYRGAKLTLYDINKKTVTTKTAPSPFSAVLTDRFHIPCCFDTKRGLVVMTRWGSDTATALTSVWFYSPKTDQWSSKTPATWPHPANVPLVYEPLMDKYVLFGTARAGLLGIGEWHPELWAYDYDSNTWSQLSRGSCQYDTVQRSKSTWPPPRFYPGSFGFIPKYGVLANWGGSEVGNIPNQKDYGTKQSIWAIKASAAFIGAGSERHHASPKKSLSLSVSPNPFKSRVTFVVSGFSGENAHFLVYDLSGRMIADLPGAADKAGCAEWNASRQPAGIYVVEVRHGAASMTRSVLLVK